MSFIANNTLNSVPVVGHVKGLIHYYYNDKEGGDKAMRSATRSAAVWGGATAGALAGPTGAIAAGAAAGAVYDTAIAIATDGKHVSGVPKIFEKPGEIRAWVDAGIDVVCDGLCGVGAGLVTKQTAKSVTKQAAKESKTLVKACVFEMTTRYFFENGPKAMDSGIMR